jgi:DNA polymerase elongation subunit (family B)
LEKIFGDKLIIAEKDEGMINALISRIIEADPDILLGHDLLNTFLDNFITRINEFKIGKGSFLGRLKRSTDQMRNAYKQNTKGNRIRSLTVGRLMLDTFLSAKEVIRENDYSIDYLALKLFGQA